jgi:hypothetical protein
VVDAWIGGDPATGPGVGNLVPAALAIEGWDDVERHDLLLLAEAHDTGHLVDVDVRVLRSKDRRQLPEHGGWAVLAERRLGAVGVDHDEDVDVLQLLRLGLTSVAAGEEVLLEGPAFPDVITDLVVPADGEVLLGLADLQGGLQIGEGIIDVAHGALLSGLVALVQVAQGCSGVRP